MVNADGSEVGSIQFQGSSRRAMPRCRRTRRGSRTSGSARRCVARWCSRASIWSAPNANSFRGSIAGLRSAYCDFTRYQGRAHVVHSDRPAQLRSLTADTDESPPLL